MKNRVQKFHKKCKSCIYAHKCSHEYCDNCKVNHHICYKFDVCGCLQYPTQEEINNKCCKFYEEVK